METIESGAYEKYTRIQIKEWRRRTSCRANAVQDRLSLEHDTLPAGWNHLVQGGFVFEATNRNIPNTTTESVLEALEHAHSPKTGRLQD